MENKAEDTSFIFGASFSALTGDVLPFSSLVCPEGFEDDDQIQTDYTDENGVTQLYVYTYIAGDWYNEDMDVVEDTDGLANGRAAWFISAGDAKTVTTAGAVNKENVVHAFTETSALTASAFPGAFCPASANVSWGVSDDAQIQTAYTDEKGVTQLYVYTYIDGDWYNEDMDALGEEDAVATVGVGFWIVLNDASETFSEVSPLN